MKNLLYVWLFFIGMMGAYKYFQCPPPINENEMVWAEFKTEENQLIILVNGEIIRTFEQIDTLSGGHIIFTCKNDEYEEYK